MVKHLKVTTILPYARFVNKEKFVGLEATAYTPTNRKVKISTQMYKEDSDVDIFSEINKLIILEDEKLKKLYDEIKNPKIWER